MSIDLAPVVHAQRQQFLAVVSDRTIDFDREAMFALQLLGANEYLFKVAAGNQASLQNAITNVAAIGVSLNPASKLAYLVPRDNKVCLDISYMGLMHIAQQSGAIMWGQAQIVRQNDVFQMEGLDKPPTHTFNPFGTDRGDIIGAYVVVKTDTGDFLTHAMPISKIHDIRDRSAAWKAWVTKKARCPWVTDEEEMIKKTVIKQAAKMWPRRDRLDSAIHNLNTDGEGLIFEGSGKPALAEEEIKDLIDSIEATHDKIAAAEMFKAAVAVCRDAKDTDAYERIKKALIDHGAALDRIASEEAASVN